MKKNSLLLFVLVALAGCDIFSSRSEKRPFIDYKEGQTSQYEYTFSIQYPDSAEFEPGFTDLVYTVVKETDDEIIVNDTLLSDLVRIQITTDDIDAYTQLQNVWFRYDDGYFAEYAYTRPIGSGFAQPKILQKIHPDYQAEIQEHLKKFSPERMITGNFNVESFDYDSIQLRTDPRLTHPFEFEIGQEWVTFMEPWLSKSKITDQKVIAVNDNHYDSYEIETVSFPGSSEFTFHSYFDSYGLVKRIVMIEQTFTNEKGESIGEGVTRSAVKRIGFSEDD